MQRLSSAPATKDLSTPSSPTKKQAYQQTTQQNTLSANMTNENSIGGTALMNPVGVKHSLRSATKAKVEELEEAALIREEEKIMHVEDEEVTSEEDCETNDAAEKIERTMLTVALVESVVQTRKRSHDSADTTSSDDASKHRYGLRRRRRQSGSDLKRLEHFQSTTEGGLARSKKREMADDQSEHDDASTRGSASMKATPHSTPPLPDQSDCDEPVKPAIVPIPAAPVPAPASIPCPPVAMRKGSDASRDSSASSVHTPSVSSILIASVSSVPNPLNRALCPPSILLSNAKATPPVTVPCPLPAVAFEELSTAVAPDTEDRRRVTINEPPLRSRGFSIDMDSIGLDMPDDSSAAQGHNDMPLGGSRDRAFSFECFAFGINADEPLPPLEQSTSSSNAADMESLTCRPRGDSIIFDPSSFQEGGIHELTALDRAHLSSLELPDVALSTTNKHPGALQHPAGRHPGSPDVIKHPATLPSAAPVAAPPIATITTSRAPVLSTTTIPSTVASTSTGSFSLDLLNKDGRIGIYLPDARRARIIRFHAKRAKRIWRKRIKYDCRKKLADSRPRIKGRFVKRSDMD